MCGIYRITNRATGEFYIGQSLDLFKRWVGHQKTLQYGHHYNPRLQAGWDAYGARSFVLTVVEKCRPDQLYERERFWIEALRPTINGDKSHLHDHKNRHRRNTQRQLCEMCVESVAIRGERFCVLCRRKAVKEKASEWVKLPRRNESEISPGIR